MDDYDGEWDEGWWLTFLDFWLYIGDFSYFPLSSWITFLSGDFVGLYINVDEFSCFGCAVYSQSTFVQWDF